jgi:outer membrane immunogenic protein
MFKSVFVAALALAAVPALAQGAPENFNGPFVGIQGGWQQDRQTLRTTSSGVDFSSTNKKDGFAYGGQIGYDFPLSPSVVLGAEVGLTGVTGNTQFSTFNLKQGRTIDATARLGLRAGPAGLVYARGGYANARYTAEFGTDRVSENRDGYTLGVGYEQQLSRNVSARIEYNYSDFGRDNLGGNFATVSDLSYKRNAITAGANFRF